MLLEPSTHKKILANSACHLHMPYASKPSKNLQATSLQTNILATKNKNHATKTKRPALAFFWGKGNNS